jgi:hypothetical protein
MCVPRRPSACRRPDAGIAGRAASCHAHTRSRTAESFFVFAGTLNAGAHGDPGSVSQYVNIFQLHGCWGIVSHLVFFTRFRLDHAHG